MSRWVTKPIFSQLALSSVDSTTEPQGTPSPTPGPSPTPTMADSGLKGPDDRQIRLVTPPWVKVAPYFVSALFFLSAIFAILAPLPLLVLYFRAGRKWAWLAALTNSVLVLLAGGVPSFAAYSILILALTFGLSEFLNRKQSIEKSAGFSLLFMGGVALLWLTISAHVAHVNPWTSFHDGVHSVVDTVAKSVSSNPAIVGTEGSNDGVVDVADVEDIKQSMLDQFPAAIGILALLLIWVNSLILLKLNTGSVRTHLGLDVQFARKWKAPSILVWPTILAFGLMLFDLGRTSVAAENVFNIAMGLYALQGLSILGFLFETWKVRPFLRTLGFSVSVFLMMPLLLCLGFFDLWFDFRGKFRQA